MSKKTATKMSQLRLDDSEPDDTLNATLPISPKGKRPTKKRQDKEKDKKEKLDLKRLAKEVKEMRARVRYPNYTLTF